jgi:hypothetical protein
MKLLYRIVIKIVNYVKNQAAAAFLIKTVLNAKELYFVFKFMKFFLLGFSVRKRKLIFDKTSYELESRLRYLFEYFGSDKSTRHSYHKVYAPILNEILNKGTDPSILEIGLGSQEMIYTSHMTGNYQPKAGINTFKTIIGSGKFFGADIDRKLLTNENEFFIDMLDKESIILFKQNFDLGSLDLILEDGLHQPRANLLALFLILDLMAVGGYYVIEDIDISWKPLFNFCSHFIPKNYKSVFLDLRFQSDVKLRDNCVYIIYRES